MSCVGVGGLCAIDRPLSTAVKEKDKGLNASCPAWCMTYQRSCRRLSQSLFLGMRGSIPVGLRRDTKGIDARACLTTMLLTNGYSVLLHTRRPAQAIINRSQRFVCSMLMICVLL